MPSEWRIDAGRGIPGLCNFESFPAAALSVERFELRVVEVVEVGIGKMKSADSSFGYNMLVWALGLYKQRNKGPNKAGP
jgi:hypothetical protein